jgi:hypothetical protein
LHAVKTNDPKLTYYRLLLLLEASLQIDQEVCGEDRHGDWDGNGGHIGSETSEKI